MHKLVSLFRLAIQSIKRGFAPRQPYEWEVAAEEFRLEQAARTKQALQLLPMLSDAARKRFSEAVLLRLLAAGWSEGRCLPSEELATLQAEAPHSFPPAVADVLKEFGGLTIYPHSGLGRCAQIGKVNKDMTGHVSQLEMLLERRLHPIGFSNIFVDDGLVIYSDDEGRIFVDGETGYQNPGSARIDYLAETFDRALEIMLGSAGSYDRWPGSPASGVWHYDVIATKPEPADWQARLQALSAAHGSLREKAIKAGVTLRPPVPIDRVIEFEKTAGIRLPDDYVFFITAVGNGGQHPPCLMGLDDWDAGYWSEARLERDLSEPCLITPELEGLGEKWLDSLGVEKAEQKWDRDEWDPMRGSMTIAEIGCGLFFRMIVNGPHRGRIFVWGDHALLPPAFQSQLTFSSWIGHWLDAVAAGQAVPFLMG